MSFIAMTLTNYSMRRANSKLAVRLNYQVLLRLCMVFLTKSQHSFVHGLFTGNLHRRKIFEDGL